MNRERMVSYGVSKFSCLIRGRRMSGKEFVEEIRKHHDTEAPHMKAVMTVLENNLGSIMVRPDGLAAYTTNV